MRDPLQPSRSPYEVLGLERDATREQIRAAFVVSMKRDPQGAGEARRTLGDPIRRAMVDLFEYDPRVFPRLRYNPVGDPLSDARRTDTLRSWEEICRAQFPDLQLIHALAVFWYWWLDYFYRQFQENPRFTLPTFSPLPIMFERLFACWATLLIEDSFWQFPDVTDIEALKRSVQDRLLRLVRQMAILYEAERNEPEITRRLQDMETLLDYEQYAARLMRNADVQTTSGRKIACGWLMLFYMGHLSNTRVALEAVIRESQIQDPMLHIRQRAREALSPTGYARYLLEQDNARTDAERLEARARSTSRSVAKVSSQDQLSEDTREESDIRHALRLLDSDPVPVETVERRTLRAEILLALGRQEARHREYTDAIEHWSAAIPLASGETRVRIQQMIVGLCQERVEAWGSTSPDRAIELMEHALRHAASPVICVMQGRLLYERARTRFASIQTSVSSNAITPAMAFGLLQSSVADINIAARYLPGEADVRALATAIRTYRDNLQSPPDPARSHPSPSLPFVPVPQTQSATGAPPAGKSGCAAFLLLMVMIIIISHLTPGPFDLNGYNTSSHTPLVPR